MDERNGHVGGRNDHPTLTLASPSAKLLYFAAMVRDLLGCQVISLLLFDKHVVNVRACYIAIDRILDYLQNKLN